MALLCSASSLKAGIAELPAATSKPAEQAAGMPPLGASESPEPAAVQQGRGASSISISAGRSAAPAASSQVPFNLRASMKQIATDAAAVAARRRSSGGGSLVARGTGASPAASRASVAPAPATASAAHPAATRGTKARPTTSTSPATAMARLGSGGRAVAPSPSTAAVRWVSGNSSATPTMQKSQASRLRRCPSRTTNSAPALPASTHHGTAGQTCQAAAAEAPPTPASCPSRSPSAAAPADAVTPVQQRKPPAGSSSVVSLGQKRSRSSDMFSIPLPSIVDGNNHPALTSASKRATAADRSVLLPQGPFDFPPPPQRPYEPHNDAPPASSSNPTVTPTGTPAKDAQAPAVVLQGSDLSELSSSGEGAPARAGDGGGSSASASGATLGGSCGAALQAGQSRGSGPTSSGTGAQAVAGRRPDGHGVRSSAASVSSGPAGVGPGSASTSIDRTPGGSYGSRAHHQHGTQHSSKQWQPAHGQQQRSSGGGGGSSSNRPSGSGGGAGGSGSGQQLVSGVASGQPANVGPLEHFRSGRHNPTTAVLLGYMPEDFMPLQAQLQSRATRQQQQSQQGTGTAAAGSAGSSGRRPGVSGTAGAVASPSGAVSAGSQRGRVAAPVASRTLRTAGTSGSSGGSDGNAGRRSSTGAQPVALRAGGSSNGEYCVGIRYTCVYAVHMFQQLKLHCC